MSRYVTAEPVRPEERYALYRLCECTTCGGAGKRMTAVTRVPGGGHQVGYERCPDCRGEGRIKHVVCYGKDEGEVGMGLITCAREGEWEGCPFGLLDRMPEPGQPAWLIRPWLPSARNLSDAGRTLARSKGKT